MKTVYKVFNNSILKNQKEVIETSDNVCYDLLFAHYKYVYDRQGNIVRSIDVLGEKEYNYSYEDGRLIRATESDITLSGEIVTAKTVCHKPLKE